MDKKGMVRPDEYPDNNIDGLVLVIDKERATYWLTTRSNSPAMLHGKLGETTFHYNVPRGSKFDGYFSGSLHIPVKIPFTYAVYSPVLGEMLNQAVINPSQTERKKTMKKEDVSDAVIVEETPAVANSRPTRTLIKLIEKDGQKLELYHYDPDKHSSIKNPKKELAGLSRKERRHWTSERDRYIALMSIKETPKALPPAKVVEVKETKVTPVTSDPTNKFKGIISDMTRGSIMNLVGNTAELCLIEDLDIEHAAFLGFLKEDKYNLLQFPTSSSDIVFMSFPKVSTAEYWLSEMRKVPTYKTQLEGISVISLSELSQSIAKKATLTIVNVRELLTRLHKPREV